MTSLHVIFGLAPPPIKNPGYAYVQCFLSRFVCGQLLLEKSIDSSKCYQTRIQDFAKRGESKVVFFAQKQSHLVPVLNKLMQLKRGTDGT